MSRKSISRFRSSNHYRPFPRQEQFHRSWAKYRLFGGAAGPGKSKALLWEAIYQAHDVEGSDSLLLRRTYPELESSLLAYFRRDVPRDWYRTYNEAKHIVTWKNGSTTRFGYCRNENDVYQYQGAEFLFIGIDELTHFTLKQWQFLTSRNRCPIPGSRACMAGASNPGNIGHAWVKALWVDHAPPSGYDRPELYDPRDYDFIRARLADNPIYANDAAYQRTLAALPEHLRRAFLDGDWNVFAGQYFDVFDFARHTVRPEALRLENWWPCWISIDWGFQHPSAVYWHCAVPNYRNSSYETRNSGAAASFDFRVSSAGSEPPPGSRIVTYREFVQPGLSPRMLAQAIAERCGRERISEVFLSPDAFAHRTSEASIAEQLGEVLAYYGLPRPAPADDDRVGGWQYMYQLLESDAWLITQNCARLIDCLPRLVRDERYIEDVRKMDGDDPADAARYGLVSGGRFAGVGAGYPSLGGFPYAGDAGARFSAPSSADGAFVPNVGAGFSPSCSATGASETRASGQAQPRAAYTPPNFSSPDVGAQLYPERSRRDTAPRPGTHDAREVVGERFSASLPERQRGHAGRPPRFVTGMPLDEQIKRQITATDPTSVAIHSQRLETAARKHLKSKPLPRRRGR